MMEKLKSFLISQYDKEIEANRGFFSDWPPSNYPFFLALMFLTATAATLAIGDEKRAEELAIYAYYFLVIGVVIRFFELALPESKLQKPSQVMKQIAGFIKQNGPVVIQKTNFILKKLNTTMQPHLHRTMLEMKMLISSFIKQHPPEKIIEQVQKIGGILKQQYLRLLHLRIEKPEKNIVVISEYLQEHSDFPICIFYNIPDLWLDDRLVVC